jgi:hypothetical protein
MVHPLQRALYTFEVPLHLLSLSSPPPPLPSPALLCQIQSEEYEEKNSFQKLLFPVPRFVVTVSDQYGVVFASRYISSLNPILLSLTSSPLLWLDL